MLLIIGHEVYYFSHNKKNKKKEKTNQDHDMCLFRERGIERLYGIVYWSTSVCTKTAGDWVDEWVVVIDDTYYRFLAFLLLDEKGGRIVVLEVIRGTRRICRLGSK
jgi:hypothetical protein